MKKRITFKMWITVFFGGIGQFFRSIFSWKNKTPFWRIICATVTVCIVIITVLFCVVCHYAYRRSNSGEVWARYDSQLSADFKYRNNGYNEGKSFIYNTGTKKRVLDDIDWIVKPLDGDSLIIVAKKGKRGFVNRFTGEIALPFKYDAAWSFTDGVAGVCEGDSVYFIDHTGKPINGKKYFRIRGYDNYAYHGNYVAIPEKGKYGLVDRDGNWVYEPEFSDITIGRRNMWVAVKNGKYGVIGADGQMVLPCEYEHAFIFPDNGITVGFADHSRKLFDYSGNLIDDFVFDDVYSLNYPTDEFDEEGNRKQMAAKMHKYEVDNYYGLMSKDGVPVTPPLYSSIVAIAPDVYQCRIPNTSKCIMINGQGENINTISRLKLKDSSTK